MILAGFGIQNIFEDVGKPLVWVDVVTFALIHECIPNTKKSGGKIISNKIMKKKHRAGQALRIAGV